MISLQDFFYVISTFAFVVIAGSVLYAAIEIVQTLKVLKKILLDVKDTTGDIQYVKNGVKAGVLSIISKILAKGGEE